MNKSPILQSGYVSFSTAGLTIPPIIRDTTIGVVLGKDYRIPDNNNFYSVEADELYNTWIADRNIVNDFDFREKILTTAFALFSTKSIYKWFDLQRRLACLTRLHVEFLTETNNYVDTGKRNLEVYQWVPLIERIKVNTTVDFEVDKVFNNKDISFTPIYIRNWVSQPGGFTDLLISLFVIFGSVRGLRTVEERHNS